MLHWEVSIWTIYILLRLPLQFIKSQLIDCQNGSVGSWEQLAGLGQARVSLLMKNISRKRFIL